MTAVLARLERAHGTRARYVVDRCRCEPCTVANREYARAVDRAHRRPDVVWQPYVDAAPVVSHVRRLQSLGVGYKRVAQLAGVGHTSLSQLMGGRRTRCRRETAAAVLAVPLVSDVAPHQLVDGAETHRLLALILTDTRWSKARLARELRCNRQRVDAILAGRPRVLRETEARVAVLAYRLCVDLAREPAA